MRFRKVLKNLFFVLIVIPLFSYYFLCELTTCSTKSSDEKITKLEIVCWEGLLPVNITIPVRHVDEKPETKVSCSLETKDDGRYWLTFDPDKPDALWITKMRFRFGGKYWETYQVTDPSIAKQLIELYKTKPFEVLLAEKREREKAEAEKAEKTEKKTTSTESPKPTENPAQ